jgi:hypothetical protein
MSKGGDPMKIEQPEPTMKTSADSPPVSAITPSGWP